MRTNAAVASGIESYEILASRMGQGGYKKTPDDAGA
jgi:hypothetical protein